MYCMYNACSVGLHKNVDLYSNILVKCGSSKDRVVEWFCLVCEYVLGHFWKGEL